MRPLALLLLAALAPAQTIQIRNDADVPRDGWVRTVVDVMPPHRTGVATLDDGRAFEFFLGRPLGEDTRAIDVRCYLEAHQTIALDLAKSKHADIVRAPLPADLPGWLGGAVAMRIPLPATSADADVATVPSTLFSLLRLDGDGAGWLTHWRCRFGRMFVADLWVHHCADQPWARAELLLTCSNPSVPDLGEVFPLDARLSFGDAVVCVVGRGPNAPLIDAGTWFGDGQARALPILLYWPRHVATPLQHSTIGAESQFATCALGLAKLLKQGTPRLPSNFDAATWQAQRLATSIATLHNWDQPPCGPNKRSGDTGAQEDQAFVRGEPFVAGGLGAERIAYLCGLKNLAARPCNHREADGTHVDVANHPKLVYWDSRPHWHTGVSPDRLGKEPGPLNASGWFGADVEHWFHNTGFAGVRLKDSPALQFLLAMQAQIYVGQHTTDPRLIYQSVPFAPRAVGWEALMATHFRDLEDSQLRARAQQHWRDRATLVLVPQLGSQPNDVWSWARDDRLGPGLRWIPWQQAIGAYFMDLAGEQLGHREAREVALRGAIAVVRDAYWKTPEGRWTCRDVVAMDPTHEVPSGHYDYFGSLLAPACVLRHDPRSEPSRSIWDQVQREAVAVVHYKFLAPEVK